MRYLLIKLYTLFRHNASAHLIDCSGNVTFTCARKPENSSDLLCRDIHFVVRPGAEPAISVRCASRGPVSSQSLVFGVGETGAGPYLSFSCNGLASVDSENKIASDFISKMGLFRNGGGILIRDMQAMAKPKASLEIKGEEHRFILKLVCLFGESVCTRRRGRGKERKNPKQFPHCQPGALTPCGALTHEP